MSVESSTSKPIMAVFSVGVVLTTMVFIAAAGNSPALTIDFRVGCSVIAGLLVG